MSSILKNTCPCGSGNSYKLCCQPLHLGTASAASAEQLMRSRYCAFVLHNSDYLINTLHPDFRQPDDKAVLENTFKQTQWLGLKIIDHKTNAQTASVEFIAFYTEQPFAQLHERSHFSQSEGHWFYRDGEILPAAKLARNDVCFCGSGKKLKKCHSS